MDLKIHNINVADYQFLKFENGMKELFDTGVKFLKMDVFEKDLIKYRKYICI